MNLPPITARAANATELRVFMTEEEKEYLKKVARKKGTTVTHLLRALALGWASEQDETA